MGNDNTYYSFKEWLILIPNILAFLWFLNQVFYSNDNWKMTIVYIVLALWFGTAFGLLYEEFENKRKLHEKLYYLTKGN